MKPPVFLLTVGLLGLWSCAEKPKSATGDVELISYVDLTEKSSLQKGAKNYKPTMTDVVSEIRYIPLETTQESLIGNVSHVEVDSGLYFISDQTQSKLLVFDSEGHFLNTIGRVGRGPGEYIYLYSYYLDRSRKEVGVLDNYERKTLIYNYEGKHLRDVEYPEEIFFPRASFYSPDGVVLFHHPIPDGRDLKSEYEDQLLRENDGKYDFVGNILKYRFKNPPGYGGISGLDRSFSYSNERLLLTSHFSNMIYTIRGDTIVPVYQVDTPKKLAEASFFNANEDKGYSELMMAMMRDQNPFSGITNIIETPQYLYLELEYMTTGLWDKRSKTGVRFGWLYEEGIDAFISLTPLTSDGDRLIAFNQAFDFLNQREAIEQGENDRLKELLRGLTENSNPVISVYTLKTNAVESVIEAMKE
ncbi:MAG: 6-bladed beta-propeller [Rikenellaceae bacterium]|jgi:hypothetical protein|nr:6-bladed beta-propeller [Rikenellaceae bacterium]